MKNQISGKDLKNKIPHEPYENYEKIAKWYDEHRTKDLMEREYLEFVLQHLPEHSSILDLGCGTGEPMAQYFIEKGHHITGVDAAQQMLDMCKRRFPNMTWIKADMRQIHLEKRFDAIIVWDSLFHLNANDQRSMFAIFQEHIKPSGILLFTSGPEEGEIWGQMDGCDFYHASLSPKEYQELLKQYSFKVLLHRIEDPNCGEHTVWIVQASNS